MCGFSWKLRGGRTSSASVQLFAAHLECSPPERGRRAERWSDLVSGTQELLVGLRNEFMAPPQASSQVPKCAFCCKAAPVAPVQCLQCGCWDQGEPPALEELCALPSTCPELQLSPVPPSAPIRIDYYLPCQGLLLLLHKHHPGWSWSFLLMTLTWLLSVSGSQPWQWHSDIPCQPPLPINSFFSQVSSNISFVSSLYVRRKNCTPRNPSRLEFLLKASPSGDLRRHCP